MRSLAGAGTSWLRRLWKGSTEAPRGAPGTDVVRPVEQVLGALETLICDGIVHRTATPFSAERALLWDPGGAPARNAFGRPVQEETGTGAPGSILVATGMTLAGLRATAFVPGDELISAHDALQDAARRLAPLVVHVANGESGHAPYHALAGAGLFQALAASAQEALDLSLVARRLAERSLVPGLIATDGARIERVTLPAEETVRSYLGAPGEPIRSPTEAQQVLFGIERTRLVRWFDPDRPVASAAGLESIAEAQARLGSRLYFQNHVAALAREAMEEIGRLTGRPLSFLHRYRLDDAEAVIVAQGAGIEVARAVADHVRRTKRRKLGVLGVTWLRPFPVREIADALDGRREVLVLESLADPMAAEPPLFREIAGTVRDTAGWICGTYAGSEPDPAALTGLCEILRRADRPRRIDLDRAAAPETTGFPRRDALIQSLANDYPELRSPGPSREDAPAPEPEGGRAAALVAPEQRFPTEAVSAFAEAVSAACGPFVKGSVIRSRAGVTEARIRASRSDFPDPGKGAPVSVLVVALGDPRALGRPLESVVPNGTVLLSTGDPPDRSWTALPAAWRSTVRERGLRVLVVGEALEAALEAVRACLQGEETSLIEEGTVAEIRWRDLPEPDASEAPVPAVVRRIEHVRTAHDSLPRFWGDVLQPKQAGRDDGVPDPLQTSGVIPAGATALGPEPDTDLLPALDPDACTGCGACWTACPDAAIGVTVLGIETLLTAASRAAGTEGKAADAMRRAHKHLAGRLNGQLARGEAGGLSEPQCRDAWTWLSGQMNLSDDDRPEHEAAFEATLRGLLRLQPVATRPFFHDAEEKQKGAGELLVLAVDPRACVGCGLCVAVCPDDALRPADRSPERITECRERFATWEQLPDTSGETLARAAEHPEVGSMAAVLLSRHCAQAQLGGAGSEPGSGERLAAKLVASLVEHHGQTRMARLAKELEEARQKLERTVREQLASGLSEADLGTLAEAVGRVAPGRAALSELGDQLRTLGAPATFDRLVVLRLVRLAGQVERYRHRLAEGEDGLGRARFGVVVADGTVADWAARFPHHPYYAPLTLAPGLQGVELARGIARGLVSEHLELLRTLRRASLEIDPPPDRPERLDAIAGLTWEVLDAEDRAACPPLLLMGDDSTLLDQGFDALLRLLDSDLPVKVVLLDGRGRLGSGLEPALIAMSHRRAFVLAGSPAHPDHLARGLADALAWPGPALIHLHAPSPLRHGFLPDGTLDRARLAVEGRAHVLFRYDPRGEGLYGLRATLEGNPAIDADWGELDFAAWAVGERRFARHFEPPSNDGGVPLVEWLALPERQRTGRVPTVEVEGQRLAVDERMARGAADRLAVWNVLREVTGAASPFTERIRSQLEQKIEAAQRAELDALKAEHRDKLSEIQAGTDQEAIHRLTQRLMVLAGYASKEPTKGNGT